MEPRVIKADSLKENFTPEGCFLYENWGLSTGDSRMSIARARVECGITTKTHFLKDIQEIYVITKGTGRVKIGGAHPVEVKEGDAVIVPPHTPQQITNTGKTDLIFYCVCTPAFTESSYCQKE